MTDDEKHEVMRVMVRSISNDNMDKLAELITTIGGNLRDITEEGNSPLHFAVAYSNDPAVKLLLHAGADVNLQDEDGNTPFHRLFSGPGRNPMTYQRKRRVAQTLIDAGADINKLSYSTHHPDLLSCAAFANMPEIGMMLLHAGADPMVVNEADQQSPLHLHVISHSLAGTDASQADPTCEEMDERIGGATRMASHSDASRSSMRLSIVV